MKSYEFALIRRGGYAERVLHAWLRVLSRALGSAPSCPALIGQPCGLNPDRWSRRWLYSDSSGLGRYLSHYASGTRLDVRESSSLPRQLGPLRLYLAVSCRRLRLVVPPNKALQLTGVKAGAPHGFGVYWADWRRWRATLWHPVS